MLGAAKKTKDDQRFDQREEMRYSGTGTLGEAGLKRIGPGNDIKYTGRQATKRAMPTEAAPGTLLDAHLDSSSAAS